VNKYSLLLCTKYPQGNSCKKYSSACLQREDHLWRSRSTSNGRIKKNHK